ncbi:eukaryotic translation initiation factor gamma subunit [Diplodia corticola]|uniref:tRNA (adenine(58)-N(1))-methyltransferase non-catalytic subunit TRM6 n=1 Tax=Diplodia corticola TaxID=236234 RepID=A0A1J9QNQ2_9PEZI|nr:eukaryotic translation initiation factor gamma subunit [Diplodia corticola]OJD30073.1 eukaryotic translation initiation factor gamma subunit [Diplodia corticola]
MHTRIRPHSYVVLRLPSGLLKVLEVVPNTTVSIGKFGSFPANHLLGRPFNVTYEILDREDGKDETELRIVPASELHEHVIQSEDAPPTEGTPDVTPDGDAAEPASAEFDIVGENGEVLMRSNRLTVDDPSRQTLSMEEIEELKKAGTGSGKEIIAKIMAAHKALDEKTAFSLAKYTLRKTRKYLRRFTVLPMDVSMLGEVMIEREGHRVMDLREESQGLIGAWANIHYGGACELQPSDTQEGAFVGGGRWLVVDDTGGLVVASLAEKMGILHPPEEDEFDDSSEEDDVQPEDQEMADAPAAENQQEDQPADEAADGTAQKPRSFPARLNAKAVPAQSASVNTLTLLHAHAQPNVALLKYFGYDAASATPATTHPLYSHLKTLSWLQLIAPEDDVAYAEPDSATPETLATWKSGKRGTYWRKRRRWERTKRVVDETRAGGFDGLIVSSFMAPATILKHTLPLLRGGAQVVVYSPTIEPLTELMDLYSRERKTAYINRTINPKTNAKPFDPDTATEEERREFEDDFPLNPTLLLAPVLQTSRVRAWQVLPGRTHPMMTSRGGPEGYVFSATRVMPAGGKVEARGKFTKKKRVAVEEKAESTAEEGHEAKKAKVGGEDQQVAEAADTA